MPRMSMFTLVISYLTSSNLPWFMDLTFQIPMQYCSLQDRTLLLSPVPSTTGYCFCFDSIPSFFLELFLHWPPVAYWAPTDLGSSSFSILSFCLLRRKNSVRENNELQLTLVTPFNQLFSSSTKHFCWYLGPEFSYRSLTSWKELGAIYSFSKHCPSILKQLTKKWSEVKVVQLCLTLCHPMDYTVHGILQVRILECVAFPFSRRSPNLGIKPRSPTLQADSLPDEPQGKPFHSLNESNSILLYFIYTL